MTGVFLCTCRRKEDPSAWLERVAKSLAGIPFFPYDVMCAPEGIRFAAARVKGEKLHKLLIAGCAALLYEGYCERISRAAGIPASGIDAVILPARASSAEAVRIIRRAHAALELMPCFEIRRVPLGQEVLVVGDGQAGAQTAREVAALGYRTTLIEKDAPAACDAAADVEILSPTTLTSLDGRPGAYTARLRTSREGERQETERVFGAVVIAAGAPGADTHAAPFSPGRVIALSDLEGHIERQPRRDWPRLVAIVLDFCIDEGRASTEAAVRSALAVRERFRREVTVLLRDVRVAARGLEALYDQAREAGVTFVKHAGSPRIRSSREGVVISCRDTVLGEDVEISCGLAAVSVDGLPAGVDPSLAAAAGIDLDAYGRLQQNNVHLLPELSNRQGVFVAGACRGEAYQPEVLRDARDAAFSVHALLSQKILKVELSHAVVDGDRCALCLTCVRVCPFKAMRIDETEKKADCIAESCRRCGICVGECPAKAITLPACTDAIVMARAGMA
jgi:quinone-modifying oxidoreductase subunit QmoB